MVFAADLMRRIDIPFTVEFIAAASYGRGTVSPGQVALNGLERLEIAGRHVLLVEDILDTGLTTAVIVADLRSRCPTSVAICTMLRKEAARRRDLPVNYVGFEIPDEFVVGYGMDYAERYRNLRGVHRLVFEKG